MGRSQRDEFPVKPRWTASSPAGELSAFGTKVDSGMLLFDETMLLSKLDGSTNNLFDTGLPAGTVITDVVLVTLGASGTVGTIDIGSDANFAVTGSDQDAWIAALDSNSNGAIERATIAGNAGQNGDLTGAVAQMTVTSSVDLTASAWQGNLLIFFHTLGNQ